LAAPDYCEAYDKDLITGAPLESTEYRTMNPYGKAISKTAQYVRRMSQPHPTTRSR
jgi:hypothetical protein